MIRRFLQRLLTKPIIRLTERYGSRPDKERIFKALTDLSDRILRGKSKRGPVVIFSNSDKFIILSDQHKGAKDHADDFMLAEKNYLAALEWYNTREFSYINLGDSEDLWENMLTTVIKHNKETFAAEKLFVDRGAFFKVFGNHDLYWDNDPLAGFNLEAIYGQKIPIYEGVILQTTIEDNQLNIFLTHGHQGDLQSDGNWFSKWFVSNVWGPFQSFLWINPNTPAYDTTLKSLHNQMMYEWSIMQENLLLITGHTHQPVFNSLTHLERIYYQLERAIAKKEEETIAQLREELKSRISKGEGAPIFKAYKPNYFNSGCCCFSDGDITGIEIENGKISLVKWEYGSTDGNPGRILLEEAELYDLVQKSVTS